MGNVCNPQDNVVEPSQDKSELSTFRVLLLGAGDTGKSTIFKQISILQNEPFDEQMFSDYVRHVRINTLRSMQALCNYATKKGIEFESQEGKRAADEIQLYSDGDLSSQWSSVVKKVENLWADKAIKQSYDERNEFQIEENGSYFFDNLARIGKEDYKPTQMDILMTRVKTLGVTEKKIILDETYTLKLVDVGGQRTERKKWFSLFDTSVCVLYLVSLSDYNQRCYEDDDTNRMVENHKLFVDVVHNKYFTDKPVIVIFNKLDIFENKMKKKKDTISKAFPEYEQQITNEDDRYNVDKALAFLEKKFREARDETDYDYGPIHTFVTKAIDTDSLRSTIDEVKQLILKYGLKQ